MITTLHYTVLRAVRVAQRPVHFDEIVMLTRMPCRICERIISHLCDAQKMDGEPWLESRRTGYWIAGTQRDGDASTGGWRALEEINTQPWFYELNPLRWVDEALSGITMDGHQTKIKNAVIPCNMRRH
jgi:hypothetical protein